MKHALPRDGDMTTMMPPTRGHDLKPPCCRFKPYPQLMPPTRGHDLKRGAAVRHCGDFWMPPTRGHDLKLIRGTPDQS